MPDELPVPPDLQHLIEKRVGDERRLQDRRSDADADADADSETEQKTQADVASASEESGESTDPEERRCEPNRRTTRRRKTDE